MELLLIVAVLLGAAALGAEVAHRLGHSRLLGQVITGVALGLTLPHLQTIAGGVLGSTPTELRGSPELAQLSTLGGLALVIIAGLELDFSSLLVVLRGRQRWIPVLSFCLPFAGGILVGLTLGLQLPVAVVIGCAIAVTALPVTTRILAELGILQSILGRRLVVAAVIDDLTGLTILALVIGAAAAAQSVLYPLGIGTVGTVLGGLALFLGAVWLADRTLGWLASHQSQQETGIVAALTTAVAMVALADLLGIHLLVAAFFGSLLLGRMLARAPYAQRVRKFATLGALGLFSPLFFAHLGLDLDPRALAAPLVVLMVLGVSVVTKVGSGILGARVAGLSRADGLALGAGLNGRGAMELVIASVARSHGLIDDTIFAALVTMGLVTTMMTPPLLRRFLQRSMAAAPLSSRLPMAHRPPRVVDESE